MERRVRGPLDVLRESWTGESNDQETAVVQVVEMREKLKLWIWSKLIWRGHRNVRSNCMIEEQDPVALQQGSRC